VFQECKRKYLYSYFTQIVFCLRFLSYVKKREIIFLVFKILNMVYELFAFFFTIVISKYSYLTFLINAQKCLGSGHQF